MYNTIIQKIRALYPGQDVIPLHQPVFIGNEKIYLADCIDTTFVSYVGQYVNRFEDMIKAKTGASYAIAVVNGTCALQIALQVSGVKSRDEVLTQALTFVATANAIYHTGATPVFIDSETEHLGMCPKSLEQFLIKNCIVKENSCFNKLTGKKISACVPVHIFGHPAKIEEIIQICAHFHIPVIEDAAESIGSYFKGKHTGTFGLAGIISFNGNKTITTGGGGVIITNDKLFAERARHITTTAKIPHKWEFFHDEPAYNFRMTNVNAAIGCAQLEKLEDYIVNKRELATIYQTFFSELDIPFFVEKKYCFSNYWLNTIFLPSREERDNFLRLTNENNILTRPAWTLLPKLPMYKNCLSAELKNAQWLEDRLVNIPSSVRIS